MSAWRTWNELDLQLYICRFQSFYDVCVNSFYLSYRKFTRGILWISSCQNKNQGVVTCLKEKPRTSGSNESRPRFVVRNEGVILTAVWRNIPLGVHGDHSKICIRIYRYYWLTFSSMKHTYTILKNRVCASQKTHYGSIMNTTFVFNAVRLIFYNRNTTLIFRGVFCIKLNNFGLNIVDICRSRWPCGLSIVLISGLNSADGMDVRLLCR